MLIIIFAYTGEDYVDDKTRLITFGIMTIISAFGIVVLLFIKTVHPQHNITIKDTFKISKETFKDGLQLLCTRRMYLRFAPAMFFCGYQQTFCYAVLPTAIGNTMNLKNHDSVLGSSSLVLGIGGIVGSMITSVTSAKSRIPFHVVILIFFFLTAGCYYICYLDPGCQIIA